MHPCSNDQLHLSISIVFLSQSSIKNSADHRRDIISHREKREREQVINQSSSLVLGSKCRFMVVGVVVGELAANLSLSRQLIDIMLHHLNDWTHQGLKPSFPASGADMG